MPLTTSDVRFAEELICTMDLEMPMLIHAHHIASLAADYALIVDKACILRQRRSVKSRATLHLPRNLQRSLGNRQDRRRSYITSNQCSTRLACKE